MDVQDKGPQSHDVPKRMLDNDVPEMKERGHNIPDAMEKNVHIIGKKDQREGIGTEDHQDAKSSSADQEVPVEESELICGALGSTQDQAEALKISRDLSELPKSSVNLERLNQMTNATEEIQEETPAQEGAKMILEDLKNVDETSGSHTVLEKEVENEEELVRRTQHQEETSVGPAEAVPKSQEFNAGEITAEGPNYEEMSAEQQEGTHIKVQDDRKLENKDDSQLNTETIITAVTETPCNDILEKNRGNDDSIVESTDTGEGLLQVNIRMKSNEGAICSPSMKEGHTEDKNQERAFQRCKEDTEIGISSSEARKPSISSVLRESVCSVVEGTEDVVVPEAKASNLEKIPKLNTNIGGDDHNSASNAPENIEVSISKLDDGYNIVKDEVTLEKSSKGCTELFMSETQSLPDEVAKELLDVPQCAKASSGCRQGLKESAGIEEDQQKTLEQIITEISAHVSVKDVHIQPLLGDFSHFAEIQVEHGRFGHIIEVYGFSSKLSTEELMEPFLEFRDRGFRLQWVDHTHALGIFSSPEDAYAASRKTHPDMKFRPLSQGTRQSKIRAHDRTASLQPFKERPPTDASVMKRMVNRALGQQKPEAEQSVDN
ncbi:uncharacterized protein [Hyperolius riggenbachi]|uniref:uncharacterized protein n=1 Tax=Hyperolius riggenbachi TaxID=752182 RepID=UPI0035A366CF